MLSVELVARVGGIFALLTLVHFIADWLFQSHAEAMAKPTDFYVRGIHCLIYTAILLGVIAVSLAPSPFAMAVIAVALWVSHFIEDTYLPVIVWAKFIRKPPEMSTTTLEGFKDFASTPLGKILLITVDQIVHLVFLVPVAVILADPSSEMTSAGVICAALAGLSFLGYMGKKAVQ